MLQKPKDLAETITMGLRHHCAEDIATGAYLIRSAGRRKSGRTLRRYWYHAPGKERERMIYAESDDDAISQIEGRSANDEGQHVVTVEGSDEIR